MSNIELVEEFLSKKNLDGIDKFLLEKYMDAIKDILKDKNIFHIIKVLKIGLGVETLEEIDKILTDFYTEKGLLREKIDEPRKSD